MAAYKFAHINPDLGHLATDTSEISDSQVKSIFISLMNNGGLRLPYKEWLDEVIAMYDLFNEHHGSKVSLLNWFFWLPSRQFRQDYLRSFQSMD